MFKQTIIHLCQNPENIASKRLAYLINKIDFDSVKIILDIGSWHLKQSIEMATIFPNAIIHAFEPNPETYRLCEETRMSLPESMKDRISVHQMALTNINGKVDFYPLDKTKTHSSNEGIASLNPLKTDMDGSLLGDRWIQKKITVNCTTLDDWSRINCIDSVDLIWMDVQGAELKVLQGSSEVLKNVKAICTEAGLIPYYENHSLKVDIDNFLTKCGFRELEHAFCKTTWSCDKAAEADVIYINNDKIIGNTDEDNLS